MKTAELVTAYQLMNAAKLTKMEDKDKFVVIKAMRKMKTVVKEFEDFRSDAQERLRDENFAEMQRRASAWNKANEGKKVAELTEEERKELDELNAYFSVYNNKVNECIREEGETEHELEYGRLSEEAFGKLIDSNDWTVNEMILLNDVLV